MILVGLIGCKGMGFADLKSFLKINDVQIKALCDADESVLRERSAELVAAGFKKPVVHNDYRRLLDDKEIDVIIIGTPDHWHCLQLVHALEAGKHVYCEKPIANTKQEADVMIQALARHPKMVQVGQWQRSNQHFADAIDFVRSGKLGNIRLVKAWAYQGWMNSVPPRPDAPAPAGVDYKMWLGPAAMRPFNPNRFHFTFRWFWDYAGGLMTDWGVHLMDYVLLGMNVTTPKSVMAIGGKYAYPNDAQETPDTLQTVYDFGSFSVLWEHAMGINGGNYGRDHGIAYIGNKGTLVLNRGGWEVIPEGENMEAIPLVNPKDSGLDKHTGNFIDAIKSGNAATLKCPLQAGYDAALISMMGNVAFKTGKKIYWNDKKKSFDDKAADALLQAKYHNGWKLPG